MFTLCFRVIYNEVIQTSKYYMRDVTAIESAWLLELAPHFYQQGMVGLDGTWPQAKSSPFLVLSLCVLFLNTLDHLPHTHFPIPPHTEYTGKTITTSPEPPNKTTFITFIGKYRLKQILQLHKKRPLCADNCMPLLSQQGICTLEHRLWFLQFCKMVRSLPPKSMRPSNMT